MIGGVNFQPGGTMGEQAQPKPSQGSGVQEAIKVLSLRLPKVVGAQGATPMALLGGQGSGGSRVDSVVNQVLSRIMPTGQPQQTPTAQVPSGPSFTGSATNQPPAMPSWPWGGQQQQAPQQPFGGMTPRVVMPSPVPQGDFSVGPDGRPIGGGQTMIGELPQGFQPPQPNFDRIGQLLGGFTYPGGGQEQDTPLF